jgi:hypothetical protein
MSVKVVRRGSVGAVELEIVKQLEMSRARGRYVRDTVVVMKRRRSLFASLKNSIRTYPAHLISATPCAFIHVKLSLAQIRFVATLEV